MSVLINPYTHAYTHIHRHTIYCYNVYTSTHKRPSPPRTQINVQYFTFDLVCLYLFTSLFSFLFLFIPCYPLPHSKFRSPDPRGKLPLKVPSVTRKHMWLPAQGSRTRTGEQLAQEESSIPQSTSDPFGLKLLGRVCDLLFQYFYFCYAESAVWSPECGFFLLSPVLFIRNFFLLFMIFIYLVEYLLIPIYLSVDTFFRKESS